MAEALFRGFEEVWRVVPSQPELMASSHGRIMRTPHEKPMPHGNNRVYRSDPTFGCIRRSGRKTSYLYFGYIYRGIGNLKVHRIVCEAFHGPSPDPAWYVIHINENALDNRPENLRWGPRKENMNMAGFRKKCSVSCQDRTKRTIEICRFLGLSHVALEAA